MITFTEDILNGKLHFLCSALDEGIAIIGEESYTEWREGWKKLEKILTEGEKRISNKVWHKKNFKVKYPSKKKTVAG